MPWSDESAGSPSPGSGRISWLLVRFSIVAAATSRARSDINSRAAVGRPDWLDIRALRRDELICASMMRLMELRPRASFLEVFTQHVQRVDERQRSASGEIRNLAVSTSRWKIAPGVLDKPVAVSALSGNLVHVVR